MFKVNDGNSKLGKNIKVINLPAGITCRKDAPCKKICYAHRGCFVFPVVRNCYAGNLNTFIVDPKKAESDIISQLSSKTVKHCRIHASGDIFNIGYLMMLIRIANKLPEVKFMMFTKCYEMVNTYMKSGGKIPENMVIIYSLWDGLACSNPNNFPTSQVILDGGNIDPIKPGYKCCGSCEFCLKCWELKKGENVIFKQH